MLDKARILRPANFSKQTLSGPSRVFFEFNITGLVRYSQANNITIRNPGGWVTSLTGNQPNAVLENASVRNY
jgi:hypothetical protein